MNMLLLASAIFCAVLLVFVAYAFINNSDFKLFNEQPDSATLEIDTSSENENTNETENQ